MLSTQSKETEKRSEVPSLATFSLRWSDGIESLKRIIKTLAKIQEELTFTVSSEGLAFRQMDASHVQLIDMLLSSSDFQMFECEKVSKFTVRAEDLLSRLERANKNDIVELSMEKQDSLNIVLRGNRNKTFSLYTIESSTSKAPLPKLNFDTSFSITAKDFIETIKDIETTSNHIRMESTAQSIAFSGKGDCGKAREEFTDAAVNCERESSSTYSIEYIQNFISTLKPESVQVQYSSKMPLRFSVHPVENGKSELQFYLAPRVQE